MGSTLLVNHRKETYSTSVLTTDKTPSLNQ